MGPGGEREAARNWNVEAGMEYKGKRKALAHTRAHTFELYLAVSLYSFETRKKVSLAGGGWQIRVSFIIILNNSFPLFSPWKCKKSCSH